jgi:hypothetical protein
MVGKFFSQPNQNVAMSNATLQNKPVSESRNSSVVRETITAAAYTPREPAATIRPLEPLAVSKAPTAQNVVNVKPPVLDFPTFNLFRPAPLLQRQQQPQPQPQQQQQQQPTQTANSGLKQMVRSELEQALLNAKEPLCNVSTDDQVTAGPYRGIYVNKREAESYRGPIPIDQFPINKDPFPEVVRKKMDKVQMTQEIGIRYLNPPPAPKPGDLIIRERDTNANVVAPPLIIRQEGTRAQTPPPRIYREAPPAPPTPIPEQVRLPF